MHSTACQARAGLQLDKARNTSNTHVCCRSTGSQQKGQAGVVKPKNTIFPQVLSSLIWLSSDASMPVSGLPKGLGAAIPVF